METNKGWVTSNFIKRDSMIHIFGNTPNVQKAADELRQFFRSWTEDNNPNILSINLSPSGRKYLLGSARAGLRELQDKFTNCTILFKRGELLVTDGKEFWPEISEKLREINQMNFPKNQNQSECDVCFDDLTYENRFILTNCGHASTCKSCVVEYITVAGNESNFPICCSTCHVPFLLADILVLFPDPAKLKIFFRSSYLKFILENRRNYNLCLTPDCNGIRPSDTSDQSKTQQQQSYNNNNDNRKVFKNCPECSKSWCLDCEKPDHPDITCAEIQRLSHMSLTDIQFEKWKKTHAKPCPSCKSPIEKNFGCNHMTCGACKAHFCWLCCENGPVCPTSSPIYEHLRSAHGGYS